MSSHTHSLIVEHDEAVPQALIFTPTGRLPKWQIDELCTCLGGASIVGNVARTRGRLRFTLRCDEHTNEEALRQRREAINSLVAVRDRLFADRDRRTTERERTLQRKHGRQEKVFLVDVGRYVEESDVLRLLDEQEGIALSREIPELDDPMPSVSGGEPRLEIPESIRHLEDQFVAAA